MRTLICTVVATLLSVATTAGAQESDDPFSRHSYVGIQYANTNTSLNEADQDFSLHNVNFNYGFRFSEFISAEVLASLNVVNDRDDIVSTLLGTDVNAAFSSIGVFAVVQNSGNFYAKGRVGYAMSKFEYSASGFDDSAEKTYGVAYGAGIGFKRNSLHYELEYVVIPEVDDPIFPDTTYDTSMITIGFVWDLD